jgi:hypothetical protein
VDVQELDDHFVVAPAYDTTKISAEIVASGLDQLTESLKTLCKTVR